MVSDLDVMIVEPSTTVQRMLSRRIQAAGVRTIRQVPSVAAALAEMDREPPHVAIGAFHFDDGTGADLVEAMRDRERTRDVAFVCVTSEDDEELLDRMRQAGNVALLRKPIDAATLATALHSTITELVHAEGAFDFEELGVLVVDDSRFARKRIGHVLHKLGISDLTFAGDGEEARDLLAQGASFDLIVTDYNMPRMNGDELVKFVRGESDQRQIPILMVTSESDDARLAAVHRHGVSAVCDKPFAMAEVRSLISTIL
ncbi:MAG: response regulator [Myxococcota bacterium]